MTKYAIGIIIGVILIISYIFFFYKPELKKEYQRGFKDGVASVGITPADTVLLIDTVKVNPHKVKPKRKPYEPPDKPVYAIDTTVWNEDGNVRVYSDNVIEEINIEPVYYKFYEIIRDTVIKMDTVYVPSKPDDDYDFVTGAVIGGVSSAILTYFIYRLAIKN